MSNHRIELWMKDKMLHLSILVIEIEILELRFDLLAHVIQYKTGTLETSAASISVM